MKLKFAIAGALLVACSCSAVQIHAQQAHSCDAAPNHKGVYFRSGEQWLALQAVDPSTTTTKGGLNMLKLAIPGGALFGMNPKNFLVFRDATAPVSVATTALTVCVIGLEDVNPRDIQIVRLIPKKDHRELAIAQGGLSHYRDADLVAIKALTESDTHVAVNITGALTPGEYLLVAPHGGYLGMSGGGDYDFSVHN